MYKNSTICNIFQVVLFFICATVFNGFAFLPFYYIFVTYLFSTVYCINYCITFLIKKPAPKGLVNLLVLNIALFNTLLL